ncbi:uncharacterized protein CEXT_719331 [Caerostris extrusa]|uniref:Uncharacterized protein n=1 Tax=Caerostris extrusa TaxID=172846 RepID=A0AAV4RXR1_CAEEX|nr:uncharacterized protein CEXT_719331 [Caerostris extrusa]
MDWDKGQGVSFRDPVLMRICVSGEKASPAHTITLNYGPSIYSRSIGWQLPFPTGPTRFADSPDSRIMKRVIAECLRALQSASENAI